MSFQDKVAVVTGAGGGMGLNIARDLLAAGARVALIDLKAPPEDLDSETALYLQGDITQEAFVADAMAQAATRWGRLDYLVNAAGVLWFDRDKSLVEMDLEVWDQVLNIDLKSMVLTCRQAIPLMQQSGGGALVHISSIQALRGDIRPQDAYQASKAAMISLSKSLAIQYAGDGIRSNCILPAGTASPMQQRWVEDPAKHAAAASAIPLGRVGTTQDMANAVLFLLSDKAGFITGTEIIVDGGVTALP